MAMTKKDFIALADALRRVGVGCMKTEQDGEDSPILEALADFCQEQNPQFKRDRWLSYLRGECGPSGGKVTK